jgi:hypothetical protein
VTTGIQFRLDEAGAGEGFSMGSKFSLDMAGLYLKTFLYLVRILNWRSK